MTDDTAEKLIDVGAFVVCVYVFVSLVTALFAGLSLPGMSDRLLCPCGQHSYVSEALRPVEAKRVVVGNKVTQTYQTAKLTRCPRCNGTSYKLVRDDAVFVGKWYLPWTHFDRKWVTYPMRSD